MYVVALLQNKMRKIPKKRRKKKKKKDHDAIAVHHSYFSRKCIKLCSQIQP